MRIELEQEEAPVVAFEVPSAPKMDLQELERLQKNNSELIHLRNKFGLLQNELTKLDQQKTNRLQEEQKTDLALEEKIRNKIRADGKAELNQSLIRHQLDLEKEKAALVELSKKLNLELSARLNISEGEARAVSLEELTPNETELLRVYHDSQRDVENHRRVVEAMKRRLESKKGEFELAK